MSTSAKSSTNQTPFWLADPSVLFRDGNFYHIIPTGQMNTVEILNSLSLLLIYMIILLLLFTCTKLIIFPLVGLILIALYYYSFYRNKEHRQSPGAQQQAPVNRQSNVPVYSERLSQAARSEREPVVVSDREAFTDYVYRMTPTCKEDPSACGVYSDIRYSRENLLY